MLDTDWGNWGNGNQHWKVEMVKDMETIENQFELGLDEISFGYGDHRESIQARS